VGKLPISHEARVNRLNRPWHDCLFFRQRTGQSIKPPRNRIPRSQIRSLSLFLGSLIHPVNHGVTYAARGSSYPFNSDKVNVHHQLIYHPIRSDTGSGIIKSSRRTETYTKLH